MNPTPSPTPSQQKPIYCQPDVIKTMERAWRRTSNGHQGTEAGFVITETPARPVVVPVMRPSPLAGAYGQCLKERQAWCVPQQEKHEAELRVQEQRFIGYAAQDTAGWMSDEVPERQNEKRD